MVLAERWVPLNTAESRLRRIMSPPPPTILIVDDEEDVRSSLRRVLKLDRYAVEEAGSLTELLAHEDLSRFFSIILDRKLPDGTSDEVLPQLKERAPNTDILIVTGFTDLDGTLTALRHGAEDYLIKPVDPDELRASLRRLARLREVRTALHESEARHAGILESAPMGILTIDLEGVVESINPAIAKIFGFPAERVVNAPIAQLMAPSHVPTWNKWFRSIVHGEATGTIAHELMGQQYTGEAFPISLTLSEVKLPHRRVITVIIEDITERKRLESDVLQASEDERQRIAQDLHDGLASHLTGISLLCRTLADQVEGTQATTANQIGDLIDEATQQARMVARGLYPVENDPEALMNSLARFASQMRHDLKVDCRFECSVPVVMTDNTVANHLYRIAQEAVNNALRHGQAEQVVINLEQPADEPLRLCIRDNGRGLDPQEISQGCSQGLGIRSMAYRAGLMHGTFQLLPRDEGGVEVTCVIPYNPSPTAHKD